jgi:hypothetical protein
MRRADTDQRPEPTACWAPDRAVTALRPLAAGPVPGRDRSPPACLAGSGGTRGDLAVHTIMLTKSVPSCRAYQTDRSFIEPPRAIR